MKKIVNIKRIICMLIIFLTIIMLQAPVDAVTSYWISSGGGGDYDLIKSSYIYCLDQHTLLSTTRVKYYVQAHIHIEGKHATGSVNSYSTTNAQMAYIVSHATGDFYGHGPRGGPSTRQCVIWYYSSTWLNSIGLGGYAHQPGYLGRTKGYNAYWNGSYSGARTYASQVDSLDEVYVADIYILRSGNSTQDLMLAFPGKLKQTGNLTVLKKDIDLNKNLRAGFKVQTKVDGNTYWLEQNGSTYNYKGKIGTTFYTDGGKKDLTKLSIKNEYRIWETVAPSDNYKLEKQPGYDKNMKAVKLSDWFKVKTNQTTTITGNNIPSISISGYVWEDIPGKGEIADSVYVPNKTDKRVAGVTVNLYKKGEAKPIATTKTNNNGEYTFNKEVFYRDLNNYYVQFDYSGMTIEGKSGNSFIPVAYNSKDLKKVVQNGSRAMMQDVATKDTDLKGIATTYTGTNANELKIYGLKSLADYTNNKLFNNYTLNYINLGIKPIYEPKYDIAEDIKYVKMVLNNHQYVYEYSKNGLENLASPQVVFQKPITKTYDRDVYPSAIYDLVDGNNTDGQIKVYVVYEILIKNSTSHQEKELYQEQKLHITSLTNTFDANRYEIPAQNDKFKNASVEGTNKEFLDMENKIKGDFDNWNISGNKATYKNEITIKSGEAALKYIQFKVKDDEIKRILENQDGLTEKDPTIVNTNGYHEYTRNDYSWKNIPNLPKTQTHYSVNQEAEDTAPYLKFKLGKERKVTGTVFEDTVDMTGRKEGEVLGNGMYDKTKEKPVSGVIVEIVSGNAPFENANISQIYIGSEDKKTYTIGSATATTNNAGEFSIEGIMPGDYYIRLTYGDGSQKIMNADGTIVSIDEYKSTIVTNEAARNALGYAENKYGKEWYKYLGTDLASVAIDSLTMREKHNSGEKQSKMFAGTALIDITIENTESNYNPSENVVNKETFYGFNFGIIVQPKQKLDIIKKITNVRLINTPNTLFNGNPETDNMTGVTDLDGIENNGSTYTRMEVEKENIYGSELTIKYNIEVKNISDVNYYEKEKQYKGWYYKFGDYSHSTPIKEEVKEVLDGFDPVLTYVSKLDNVTEITKNGAGNWGERETTIKKMEEVANSKQEKYSYEKVLLITGWKLLERNDSDNITIEFSKVLSNQDDLDFIGVAAIHLANNATAKEDIGNNDAIESLNYAKPVIVSNPSLAEATVTAPTGSLLYVAMITAGVVGIIILGFAAVTILKKKKIIK